MANGESNGHVIDVTWPRKVKLVTPNTLRAQYLENSWRCYLATIANYYTVCCGAVRSAILATAWLFVLVLIRSNYLTAIYCRCSDFTVRLTGGDTNAEGRLEVYYNSQWGTVCKHMLSYTVAGVACNSLGFGLVLFRFGMLILTLNDLIWLAA